MPPKLRMTRPVFDALARGGGGVAAVDLLTRVRRSRTLQLIRLVADRWPGSRRAFDDLTALPAEAVRRVVDHPAVGAWATRTAIGSGEPAWLAHVACAAAVRAGVRTAPRLPRVHRAWLPTLGALEEADASRWEPTPRVAVPGGPTFLVERWEDIGSTALLPFAEDLDLPRWQDGVTRAWQVLARDHADVAGELVAAITVLAPLREPASGVNSATHADAYGCVFMSPPKDPEITAMTLAHELQHTKLVALMDLFPLVAPDEGRRYYAPWRDDPRPAIGLLHGAYAHLGVAKFCRRAGREVEFARWRTAALEVSRTLLASGELTETGQDFVQGMETTLRRWCEEPVSPTAHSEAHRLATTHRARHDTTHGR
ncbi:HEXXH motif-containing putative peptide modification protein [Actinosynnema sp. NPDC050436]|uniref:aKG-HExxH-type peptide beta-hydroxylase n=1 Tax=Actinosynnema sp. NPDC050436 TaxID=3155659 RepID=UPI0033C8D1E2